MSFEDPDKPLKNVSDDRRTGYTFRGQNILLTKKQGKPLQGLAKKGLMKGMYPEEKKIEAATVYAATGSLQRASELTGVPIHTLRSWRSSEDFQALLKEVWTENNEKIDSKFTEIIEKSLDQIIDRLDSGDFHVSRNGELVRKPISAKELSLVQAINVDKRQLLRGLPTSRSDATAVGQEKQVSRLEKLAETFENLAKFGRQPKTYEITDVEPLKLEKESVESLQSGENGAGELVSETEGREEGKV